MDKIQAVYFLRLRFDSDTFFKFARSSETEVGSAEEQPARDNLMTDENVNRREASCFPLIFLLVIKPQKTYQ
jgi:hypothetical protein